MKRFLLTISILMVLILIGCGMVGNRRLVEFKGRQIDLEPYFEGFPYSGFTPFYSAGKMFFYERGDETVLKQISLEGEVDLTQGEIVSDIDFSKRNVWGIRYRKVDGRLYWLGDEINDEVMNIYRLDPETQAVEKITDVPYIFGWRWDPTQSKAAYIARLGTKEKRLSELRILDLNTQEEKTILQDTPEYRLIWGSPSWQPDGKGVVVSVVKGTDRTYGNLAYVDFMTKKMRLITDPARPRQFPEPYRKWLNANEFIYSSNEDGYSNLYIHNIRTMRTRQLTRFNRDVSDIALLTLNGEHRIFAVVSNPIENEIYIIDLEGRIRKSKKIDRNLFILDDETDKILVQTNSATIQFRIDELEFERAEFSFTPKITLPPDLEERTLHTKVERVEYPTFDTDNNTGKTRLLHGFLYHPKNPLPDAERLVMIQSFYGGGNYYSTRTQILAEAGIIVFSPSPRGCDGFGREFSSLNDKDLGGNEIIDVIYAAKYIQERLGIPPDRIGVYGGSHGGYATMRLLTFPGEINGNKAHFDWGFGISHAGFSDIVHFYHHCNIPDWVLLEAGDPETEAEKLKDRSPLYHAEKMSGKLLLTHGTNDSRVPIEGSLWMADSLRKYKKDVTLFKFEGQGHGIKGLKNQITYYNRWFAFLEDIGEH